MLSVLKRAALRCTKCRLLEIYLYLEICQVDAAGSLACAVSTFAQSFSLAGTAAMSTAGGSLSSSSAILIFFARLFVLT